MSTDNLDDVLDEALAESVQDDLDPAATVLKKKKKKKHLLADVDPSTLPAGHTRDEAMKVVADTLAQRAEERTEDEDRYRLDPSKFEIDNEIASKRNSLEVTHADPERHYCWARFKCDSGVSQVEQKLALTIGVRELATGKRWQEPIWHVVNGSDKECPELKQVDGTRRLGDVILLWCKRNVHEAVQAAAEAARQRMMGAPARAAAAFEAKTGIKVVTEAQMATDPRFAGVAKHAEGYRRDNVAQDAQIRQQLLEQQRRGGRAA